MCLQRVAVKDTLQCEKVVCCEVLQSFKKLAGVAYWDYGVLFKNV